MISPMLLAVPNVSEGRDPELIGAIGRAFVRSGRARLLDIHSDADHHRSVYTLAGHAGTLSDSLLEGAAVILERVDLRRERGLHPHVGALDVLPLVHLEQTLRGAACAEALVVADGLARELGLPVFLYGSLARGRTRAELRRGGLAGLSARMASAEMTPDFGPARPHPTAGATLVGAREPLVAFNLELAPPATPADARQIAMLIREGGSEGLPGLRAIGLALSPRGVGSDQQAPVPQVSMNVERPLELSLAEVVRVVRGHAEVARAEIVGLAPRAALDGFPPDLPMPGFDPAKHVIENALGL
jgi:glutamate formiminotransferase/glutamate formiminotransferase/formiminotetrahydrofolate cyclodeaminase